MSRYTKDEIIAKLNNIIELHERMRGEQLLPLPQDEIQQKRYAFAHTMHTSFVVDNDIYKIHQVTTCTTKITYHLTILKNGIKLRADIRYLVNLLCSLQRL